MVWFAHSYLETIFQATLTKPIKNNNLETYPVALLQAFPFKLHL